MFHILPDTGRIVQCHCYQDGCHLAAIYHYSTEEDARRALLLAVSGAMDQALPPEGPDTLDFPPDYPPDYPPEDGGHGGGSGIREPRKPLGPLGGASIELDPPPEGFPEEFVGLPL